ncbi:F1F0 ATPase F1 subunit gamma [Leptolyngbya sp. BL0902]|uniref:F0F1 ATP synthase subunit gamma n=1 Tax=Leptolyngbya sp. BL0902 TaxID=1115757 RepID=UPI0018E8CE72|nr:F0F1 ATP synthase subunit gamma [Leptolyngbya sp. BL0902]QQE63387.1 F1F0 ATPase F1 subunit gamma [Leptolyngbya sp. BL0902]
MLTLEALQSQIHSIEDLQAVVRTMKALAMVSLRQYERARLSLADYQATVELGLQGVLHHQRFAEDATGAPPLDRPSTGAGQVGLVIIGSDHGLCGSFNEQIVAHALDYLHRHQLAPHQCRLAAVGARVVPYLDAAHHHVDQAFSLPSSLAGIPVLLQDLWQRLEQWRFPDPNASPSSLAPRAIDRILLCSHQSLSSTTFQPRILQLLPLDPVWLQALAQRPWPSVGLPLVPAPWAGSLDIGLRQYLLVALHRATVESLASENAARLGAMQAAEKNIEERLADLNADYRQQRQNAITGELLDIVGGFEALNQAKA